MAQPAEPIRIFIEFMLALLILVVSMPIILIALVLVRATSRGPVIYTQKRLGRGGRVFTIYKIRTMYRDSEPNGRGGLCRETPESRRSAGCSAGATSTSCRN